MEESKNNNKNIIIVLLVIIVFILAALCAGFATGILSLNLSKDNNEVSNNTTNTTSGETEGKNKKESKDDTLLYEPIISEYKKFLEATDNNRDYTYVNMIDAVTDEEIADQRALDFYYALYDVDKDDTAEFFVAYKLNNAYTVLNIFNYKNNAINKVTEYWGRSHFVGVYDNGTLVNEGSNGANEDQYVFRTIDSEEVIFNIVYEGGSEVIKTSNYGATNYATIDEMIKDNTKGATKIDINTFDWKSIN